jgi:hypothetical protein
MVIFDQILRSEGKYCSPPTPYFHGHCIYFVNGSQPVVLRPSPLLGTPATSATTPRSAPATSGAALTHDVRPRSFAQTDETRVGRRRGDGSGTTQLEELFEKPPRDDEPEPPIGHPPRFHGFILANWAAALRRGLAQAPSPASCFTTGRENARRRRRLFCRFRFTGPAASR